MDKIGIIAHRMHCALDRDVVELLAGTPDGRELLTFLLLDDLDMHKEEIAFFMQTTKEQIESYVRILTEQGLYEDRE